MKKFELPRTPAQWLEAVMNAIFFLCGILAVGCVAVITIYMFLSGLPAIGKIGPLNFLFGTEWASTASERSTASCPSCFRVFTAPWARPSSACRWAC